MFIKALLLIINIFEAHYLLSLIYENRLNHFCSFYYVNRLPA